MSSQSEDGSENARFRLFGVHPVVDDEPISLHSAAASTTFSGSMLRSLAEKVGGLDALGLLGDEPFADEPFRWTGIEHRLHEVVADILAALDAALGATCPPIEEVRLEAFSLESIRRGIQSRIDVEYRTITRRLLARVARAKPDSLTRSASHETAAALVWLALMGNDHFRRQRLLKTTDIWYLFGVETCSRRGRTLYRSLGLPESSRDHDLQRGAVPLHDPELMHSNVRKDLVWQRLTYLVRFANEVHDRQDSQPLQQLPDGSLRIAAKPVTPRWAMRSRNDGERSMVVVTFGEREDQPEVLALSVPDARHLISMLENALALPFLRTR